MRTILFIHQAAELYGSDKTLLILLSQLDKERFRAVVVVPEDGPLKPALELLNVKVVIAPVLKLYRKMFTPKNLLSFIGDVRASVKILKKLDEEFHFDLVYSNTLAVLLGMIYARKRKLKHIWHVHEIIKHPKLIAAAFPKLLNRYADVVICNSVATKSNLIDRIPSLKDKCVVIYNGVDKIAGDANEAELSKKTLGFSDDDLVVTLVGRISRLKGHKWLIGTYLEHLNTSSVKLLFVGSPVPGQEYYLEEVEEMTIKHDLQDRVKILPFTKNLKQIWGVTDIAVMPSTEAESFGLVALEAMLEKKPVIASNHGGVTEIVAHNVTGILVEPQNSDALSAAIKQLAADKALRQQMGEAGYGRAIEEFSQARYIANISKLLQIEDDKVRDNAMV